MLIKSGREGAAAIFGVALSGDRKESYGLETLGVPKRAGKFVTVHSGQPNVQHDHAWKRHGGMLKSSFCRVFGMSLMPLEPEQERQRVGSVGVVVDDQQALRLDVSRRFSRRRLRRPIRQRQPNQK